jgi:hypothetical protein
MVAHLRADARARVSGEDYIGGLVGKVTVYALACESAAATWEEAAAFHFVAGETT